MTAVTKFDERHCHKWALLLRERRDKLNKALALVAAEDFNGAKLLFLEIFGVSSGRKAEPGMAGSLLYHMAMVTKMETETRMLLQELRAEAPDITQQLWRFYGDFALDMVELTKPTMQLRVNSREVVPKHCLGTDEKIALFTKLNEKTHQTERMLNCGDSQAAIALEELFRDWAKSVAEMRLRQEYETIKGLLTSAKLAESFGVKRLQAAMEKVQEKFGQETVSIALNVTLKVGLRRERLQSIMLSDHFIDYTMNVESLDGHMQFLNCPIYGGHKYIGGETGITDAVASLFCKHFCFAHAKAMLETVLPFTFALSQPQRMATHGQCEFYLKLGYSPAAKASEKFVPLIVSWNLTRKCNLKCSHCYINATTDELKNELNTEESKRLIDQISEVSRPLLILSGGEPLLRQDVFEILRYGTEKGLRMGLGSNGGLIDAKVAKELKEAGVKTVSISLDSSVPKHHDEFRGVSGSWEKAVNAIKALRENNVLVQVNTTLTQQNYNEIDDIMSLVEEIGVENFHLFFSSAHWQRRKNG